MATYSFYDPSQSATGNETASAQNARKRGYQGPFFGYSDTANPQDISGQLGRQAQDTLQSGFYDENPAQGQFRQQLSDAVKGRINSIGQNGQENIDTQSQQAFKKQANDARRNAGGTGDFGSQSYNRNISDIGGQVDAQRAQALQSLEQQNIASLGNLNTAQGQVTAGTLQEQQAKLGQMQTLADSLEREGQSIRAQQMRDKIAAMQNQGGGNINAGGAAAGYGIGTLLSGGLVGGALGAATGGGVLKKLGGLF